VNDVEKREEEMNFVSDTVKKLTDENMRNCECMIDNNEAEKCKNDEITKREPTKLIAEAKKKDFTQKNKRNMKRNDGELDDYNEKAKICDEDHESDKRMKLDDETMDLNDYFLDSGQVDNEEEDGASKMRREVEEMIENSVHMKETEFEAEKHENEENYKFGREIK